MKQNEIYHEFDPIEIESSPSNNEVPGSRSMLKVLNDEPQRNLRRQKLDMCDYSLEPNLQEQVRNTDEPVLKGSKTDKSVSTRKTKLTHSNRQKITVGEILYTRWKNVKHLQP